MKPASASQPHPGGICVVEDDGSLAARWQDDPGLVDSLLSRGHLDPFTAEPLSAAGSAAFAEAIRVALTIASITADETQDQVGEPGHPPVLEATQYPAAELRHSPVVGTSALSDLSDTVAALTQLRVARNRLEAAEAVLLEVARRQGLAAEADFITDDRMYRWDSQRREELVGRAVIAEVALAINDGHDAVSTRMDQAQVLVARAPRTLESALAGRVQWRNAAYLADQVADLSNDVAGQVDAAAVSRAETANPAKFRPSLRRIIDRIHPTPIEVRHQEAAAKRCVRTDPAADGMAYLTLFAPAVAVHAIWDRLTQTGRTVRTNGDGRTLQQLRTDTAIALLLDDGTLDLAAATAASVGCGSTALGESTTAEIDGAPHPDAARDLASLTNVEAAPDRDFDGVAGQSPHLDLAPELDPAELTRACGNQWSDTLFSLARIARSIRPRVFVTVPVLSLIGACDEPALLNGQVPIDADTARELAGLATSFTRLLADPYRGSVIGVDAKTYRPPAGLRHWVQLRDATCRFPGCLRRAVESDIDHNREWSQGGATVPENLAALCRRHHSLKTIGAFDAVAASGSPGDVNISADRTTGASAAARATSSPPNTSASASAVGSSAARCAHSASAAAPLDSSAAPSPSSAAPSPSSSGLTWTSPTGRQYVSYPETIPATCHPPGSRLPLGPTPSPDDLSDDGPDDPWGEPPF